MNKYIKIYNSVKANVNYPVLLPPIILEKNFKILSRKIFWKSWTKLEKTIDNANRFEHLFFFLEKKHRELKSTHRRTRMWTSAKLTTYKVKRNNKNFKTLRHLTRDNKIHTTGQNSNLRPTKFELLKSEGLCWPYVNCRMFFSIQHVINTP